MFEWKRNLLSIAITLPFASASQAELQMLGDESLEAVTGQTGLTVELHKQIEVSEVVYSDKDSDTVGGILEMKDIVIGNPADVNNQQAISVHQYDVDGTDGLVIKSTFQPTRLQIGSISVGDHRGSVLDSYATRKSLGTFMYDWTGTSEMRIRGKDAGDSGFIINSTTNITDSDFRWVTNGNTMLVDGMQVGSTITDMTIDVLDNGTEAYLALAIPSMQYNFTLSGLCFAESENCGTNSLGTVQSNMAYKNSYVHIFGGGREGRGIGVDAYFEIDEAVSNSWSYTDEATLTMANMTGYSSLNGFTFDIGQDEAQIGDHIALQFDRLEGNFRAATLEIGAGNAIGEFQVIYDFQDGVHDSVIYQNQLKVAPGIAWAGQSFADLTTEGFTELETFYSNVDQYADGISIYNEWNLTADIIYTDRDNGNDPSALLPGKIVVSNFQSHGSGYASFDIRQGNSITGNGDTYLAVGIRNYQGSYSIDGLRVGDENAQLQGGTELLLPLGIYPAYEFTMNAAVEVRTGGQTGSGVRFDGDVLITDGTFAYSTNILNEGQVDERVVGIWADDVRYEYHFREYTLDVGEDLAGAFPGDAIRLRQGERISDLDIGNLRWGDKNTGDSLGRIRVQKYQQDSQLVIQAGGAGVDSAGNPIGATCIGGSGADSVACENNGGQWLDRGTDGLTVSLKQNWMNQDATDLSKVNRITWENNRTTDGSGNPVNDTGTQFILDNIRTSDGYNLTENDFGMQLSLAVDVAPTRVIKKEDGPDENGISGTRGQEKVVTGTGPTDYVYKDIATLTATDKANRPLGFAVQGQLQFKELDIESIQLKHPNVAQPQTVIHELKMQNFNVTSNLTATPIN